MLMLLLKIIGAILAFCSLSVIAFFALCCIPEGDPLPEKRDDKRNRQQ